MVFVILASGELLQHIVDFAIKKIIGSFAKGYNSELPIKL